MWAFEEALDCRAFHTAVVLYRGSFLDGFHVAALLEFERWGEVERARLTHRYEEALETLEREAERVGDTVAAVHWWHRLSEHDQFSSRIALGLMRALVAVGDRAEALREGEIHERILREELGADPDTGEKLFLKELRQRVLQSGTRNS